MLFEWRPPPPPVHFALSFLCWVQREEKDCQARMNVNIHYRKPYLWSFTTVRVVGLWALGDHLLHAPSSLNVRPCFIYKPSVAVLTDCWFCDKTLQARSSTSCLMTSGTVWLSCRALSEFSTTISVTQTERIVCFQLFINWQKSRSFFIFIF